MNVKMRYEIDQRSINNIFNLSRLILIVSALLTSFFRKREKEKEKEREERRKKKGDVI